MKNAKKMVEPKKKTVGDLLGTVEITPKKDHEIHFNEHHIYLKEGKPAPVPQIFLQNLVTSKVIDKLPK
jgi:hypothetical protein